MDLPDSCRLHLGLYMLANKRLVVPYDVEPIINQIFGGEDPGVYEMLQVMHKQGLITIDQDMIYLPAWPKGKSRPQARMIENLSLVKTSDPYHPMLEDGEHLKDKIRRSTAKGLLDAAMDRDLQIFMEKWPWTYTTSMLTETRKHWSWLVKTRAMPPLNVLIFSLENHLPKNYCGPVRWLKLQEWLKYWKPERYGAGGAACPVCGDSKRRIVFDKKTGRKKVMVCSYCLRTKNEKAKDLQSNKSD